MNISIDMICFIGLWVIGGAFILALDISLNRKDKKYEKDKIISNYDNYCALLF